MDLNITNLDFGHNELFFRTPVNRFNSFKETGFLQLEEDDLYKHEEIEEGTLCLICCGYEDLYIFDDTIVFEKTLKDSLFARFSIKNGKKCLEKVYDKPLFDLINEEFQKRPHKEKFFNYKKYGLEPPPKRKPYYDQGSFRGDPKLKDFIGIFSVCNCGIPECWCSFAYIKDYELLVYAEATADFGGINYIWILPEPVKK